MKKVKNIFLKERSIPGKPYATGLILELEDGRFMAHASTDVVQTFSEISKEVIEHIKKEDK